MRDVYARHARWRVPSARESPECTDSDATNTQQVPRDTRNTSLFACSEAPSRALLLRLATVTPSQNVTFNHNRLSARALVV